MRLIIETDEKLTQVRIGGEGIPDRATALDLIEHARQAIHQQGAQERAAAGIVLATAAPRELPGLRVNGRG